MGKFHAISHLQKYDHKGPIIESILSPYYMVHLALSSILNYYYWAQVYPLNLGEHNHIPPAQVSGVLPTHPVLKVGEGHHTQAFRQGGSSRNQSPTFLHVETVCLLTRLLAPVACGPWSGAAGGRVRRGGWLRQGGGGAFHWGGPWYLRQGNWLCGCPWNR